MRNYFIRYDPRDQVNYLYIFMLYGLAEHNKYSKRYDTIPYESKRELAARIKDKYGKKAFSCATLGRILYSMEYTKFIKDAPQGYIYLNNEFSNRGNIDKQPFVIITDKEADFLIEQGDKQLAAYYCYLKYYCGLAAKAGVVQDFTAKQYLRAIGLSVDNHNNLSRISSYNTLLASAGFIHIKKFRDNQGNERNVYSLS